MEERPKAGFPDLKKRDGAAFGAERSRERCQFRFSE